MYCELSATKKYRSRVRRAERSYRCVISNYYLRWPEIQSIVSMWLPFQLHTHTQYCMLKLYEIITDLAIPPDNTLHNWCLLQNCFAGHKFDCQETVNLALEPGIWWVNIRKDFSISKWSHEREIGLVGALFEYTAAINKCTNNPNSGGSGQNGEDWVRVTNKI